jgi:hypothetical protein
MFDVLYKFEALDVEEEKGLPGFTHQARVLTTPPFHRFSSLLRLKPSQPLFSIHTQQAKMATANAYPPGGTFLDTLKKSFADVPVDKEHNNAVATTEFLEAAESLTTLFGTSPFHFLSFV